VKARRLRIASIMLIVAVAALNLGVLQARILRNHGLLLSALPMANALAVGLATARTRRGSRPFLVGFLAFGAIAVVAYAAAVTWFDDQIKTLCIQPVLCYLVRTIGLGQPLILLPAEDVALVVMLVLPQFVFALMGGLISRRYRISIITRLAQPAAHK
jgi:hypothetical protein